MASGGSTPKATELEKKLAASAEEMYATADNLSGGMNYLKAEATKVDRSDRYAEQANSDTAVAMANAIKNPLANVQSDTRGYVGGEVAAEAQAESEAERAGLSLANAGLGTKTIMDSAIYKQAADDQRKQFIEEDTKRQKAAILPTMAGTALGAFATSTEGQGWIKSLFSDSGAAKAAEIKKPFTGSFS